MFTDLVDYHVHPGTLHAKSIVGPGRLSTMYRGHYINLSQDCEYNLYMNMKKQLLPSEQMCRQLVCLDYLLKIALYTGHRRSMISFVQKG